MLEYVKVDQEADPYSIAYAIAQNALVARAKSKGELLAHLKKRGVEDDVANATIYKLTENGLINDAEFAKANLKVGRDTYLTSLGNIKC